jgi:outer membrane biosynthesis protein TonB
MLAAAVAWLLACASGESEPTPAPPVAPIAQPAAEPEPATETEPVTETATDTAPDTPPVTETEPVAAAEPDEPRAPTPPRTKRGRFRDSDFCRRARARDATETVCDAEGNCDSPGVPPPCR